MYKVSKVLLKLHEQKQTMLELSPTLGDTSGNPSERYYWSHYGRVMTERRTELGFPYHNPLEPTLKDIIDNETIARKELNYDR